HPGKPVIAAVNGACLAGGLELLLGTDIRIAAPHARFGLPEPRHGLIPFAGALSRLPKQIPPVVAAELLLTGDPIGAERAQQIGLVNHLAAPGDLMETARRIAGRIAANGPLAVAEITASLRAASPASEAAAAEAERAAMERVMASADAAEGPRAFIEKRAPRFTGG
ncbi:MAG: enoyl-CoA hydratase-related protein, partial [Paracoccus sp. (in: a-proteobacteria)]|nr:enoyl-CoA hydratase-related protein [Paracoccus sp. (in: a-proteobacteria)]